jgi:hypothetical protein
MPDTNIPLISFCSTCANRAYQLKQTFAANARLVSEHLNVEWVILNYSSNDDLDAFMASELAASSDRIRYARQLGERNWHASVAKNIAHRLARGQFLVNLDCDNFIGDAIGTIQTYLDQGIKLLHLWSGQYHDGTFGRIGMLSELFLELGGYDESFHPMGFQDGDLLRRAAAHGIPIIHVPCASHLAIPNTKEESIRHCSVEGYTWRDYDRLNRQKSQANLVANHLRANTATPWAPLAVSIENGAKRSVF